MQVRGLPRQLTRGAALAAASCPQQRSGALPRRACGRRLAGDAVSMGSEPGAALAAGAAARLVSGSGGGGRGDARRLFRCGARPSWSSCYAARALGGLREHHGPHPDNADGPRPHLARAQPQASRLRHPAPRRRPHAKRLPRGRRPCPGSDICETPHVLLLGVRPWGRARRPPGTARRTAATAAR